MKELTEQLLLEQGYYGVRLLNGKWVGLYRFMYTTSIVVNLAESGYGHRYCYEEPEDAKKALDNWDGNGDPGGPWIKRKGLYPNVDFSNPNVELVDGKYKTNS